METTTNSLLTLTNLISLFNWDVKSLLTKTNNFNASYPLVLFGEFLNKAKIDKIKINDKEEYKILGVRSYGKGVFLNRIVKGETLTMKEYQKAKPNHLFWCKVDTKNGAFGIIKDDLADGIASSNMTFAEINTDKINVDFLQFLFTSKGVMEYLDSFVTGTTNRKYIRPEQLLNEIKIPLPTLTEQNELVNAYTEKIKEANNLMREANELESEIERYLYEALGIEKNKNEHQKSILKLINFSDITEWGMSKTSVKNYFQIKKYDVEPIGYYADKVYRGKSPMYDSESTAVIINQKCNRWNNIELQYAKTVNKDWLEKVNSEHFTKLYDILVNSTGEGTIGRATCIVDEKYKNMMYDSHVLCLRLNLKQVNPLFFTHLFNIEFGQIQVGNLKSAETTNQTELGVNNLKKIQIPIPPLEIQKEIVQHIQAQKENIKHLRQSAAANRTSAMQEFEQAIFNKKT